MSAKSEKRSELAELGMLAIIAGGTVFIAYMMMFVIFPDDAPRDMRPYAMAACQTAIKTTLRDPSSAEWVDRTNWPMTREGRTWTMVATVRARNGFGGMAVERFRCDAIGNNNGHFAVTGLKAL